MHDFLVWVIAVSIMGVLLLPTLAFMWLGLMNILNGFYGEFGRKKK